MSPRPKNFANYFWVFIAIFNLFRCGIFCIHKIIDFPANFNQKKTDEFKNLQIHRCNWIQFTHDDTFEWKSNKYTNAGMIWRKGATKGKRLFCIDKWLGWKGSGCLSTQKWSLESCFLIKNFESNLILTRVFEKWKRLLKERWLKINWLYFASLRMTSDAA